MTNTLSIYHFSPLTLGLRAVSEQGAVPLYSAGFLIANFVSAYLILASRHPRQWYGFDHNSAPSEDIDKYGEALVSAGKLSRSKPNAIKRWQAAGTNALENLPLFIAAVLLGTHAGVDHGGMNGLMMLYTVARLCYAVVYQELVVRGSPGLLVERDTHHSTLAEIDEAIGFGSCSFAKLGRIFG
ncbi:hypothetical protein BJ878DRAFT_476513 [Calycina marina]|uniref:MAPEG family protein n=1 Tax=Calycina marina TaxID=1763456 RepID=A0A9P7ZAY3_9HELO|nr:hypothetical protein BJ878DRAFT_476513 [Calycina marina]